MNRNQIFSRLAIFVLTIALIFVGTVPATAEAFTETENIFVPIEPFQTFVPCAAGGAGEVLELTGTLHILFHFTLDNNGGFHAKTLFQPQGVTGIGQTTGDIYHATGGTQDQFNGTVGTTITFVNNFRMIGPGPGNNYLVHETFHFTINANGEVTAEVENFKVECK